MPQRFTRMIVAVSDNCRSPKRRARVSRCVNGRAKEWERERDRCSRILSHFVDNLLEQWEGIDHWNILHTRISPFYYYTYIYVGNIIISCYLILSKGHIIDIIVFFFFWGIANIIFRLPFYERKRGRSWKIDFAWTIIKTKKSWSLWTLKRLSVDRGERSIHLSIKNTGQQSDTLAEHLPVRPTVSRNRRGKSAAFSTHCLSSRAAPIFLFDMYEQFSRQRG